HLVAELLLHGAPADIVLIGVAMVADRADIDEADLEGVGRQQPAGAERQGGGAAERRHAQGEVPTIDEHAHSLIRFMVHAAGWKVLPMLAGAFSRIRTWSREISTSTRIVAR